MRIWPGSLRPNGPPPANVNEPIEPLDLASDSASFAYAWMFARSRRLAILTALDSIREELGASIRQTTPVSDETVETFPSLRAFERDPTIERNRVPRCALLLTFFEGMPLHDAAILLDAERGLVQKASRPFIRAHSAICSAWLACHRSSLIPILRRRSGRRLSRLSGSSSQPSKTSKKFRQPKIGR